MKRRGLTLAACCGVHSLQDGLGNLIYVLLPILAEAFGLNYSQIGMIRAAKSSAMTLFEIPSGILSERFGERTLLGLGLLCVGLGYAALSQADGYTAILACLFVAGTGAAFQHTLSSSLITRTFSGTSRRTALGTYNSAGDVGKLAVAGLFTLLLGAGFAWQGLAMGFGLAAVFSALLLVAALRIAEAGGRVAAVRRPDAKSPTQKWGIRNRPAFGALILIVSLDIAVQAGFLTFLAFLMLDKQIPTSLGAFAVVLTLAGGVFGKFTCGFLAAKLGVIRALLLVQVLTAIGIVAVLFSPAMIAYILLPFLGIVLQGSSSITYGSVADLIDEDRHARGFGLIYSISSASVIMAPVGFGLVADAFGLHVTMLALVVTTLLTIPLCPLLRQGFATQQG